MADSIKIKRSDATATPASLAAGELAYSELSGNFFYGRILDGAPVIVGGKTDHDKLTGIEAGAQVNTVTSVASRTGAIVVTTADLADFNTAADARIGAAVLNDLNNVTGTPSDGQVLTYTAGTTSWGPAAPGTGVTTFVALNDTPASFAGAAGYIVKVNAGGTALEFSNGVDGGTF